MKKDFKLKWILGGLVLLVIMVVCTGSIFANGIQVREFNPEIQIPGTNIEAGFLSVYQDRYTVGKVGFRINNDLYYLEKAHPEKFNELDVFGDNQYAILNDLLIIGTCGSPTGHGRWLLLFKFSKDNIRFIDALHQKSINKMTYDFAEIYDTTSKKPKKNNKLNILTVKDNTKTVIKIYLSKAYSSLFVYVTEAGFKINLNPDLYKPLFYEIKGKSKTKKPDIYRYFIYGFLSNELNKEEIKDFLRKKKISTLEPMEIIDSLNILNKSMHVEEEIILRKINNKGDK